MTGILRMVAGALLLAAVGCSSDEGNPRDGAVAAMDGAASSACATEMPSAASTTGCNGGFAAAPQPNGPLGDCSGGSDATPAGSCTTSGAICMGDDDGSGSTCEVLCTPPATYVDSGECPTGFRCFRVGTGDSAYGQCFRDCDASHACPDGWTCSAEARCSRAL